MRPHSILAIALLYNRRCWLTDPRTGSTAATVQLHGTRVKVMSLSVNPQQTNLLLSTGNDRLMRLWDIRKLPVCGSTGKHTDISSSSSSSVYTDDDDSIVHDSSSSSSSSSTAKGRHFAAAKAQCLGEIELPRIASNAVFSPYSGTKILATCGDNRLRIWSNFCGTGLTSAAAVEHIHSHDFNRYLAHFRAVFDPKDPCERRLIIGRYISEALYDLPLKPVDVIDAETGALIAELAHPAQKLICPVNAVHPSEDVICSGASTHVISWQWCVTGDRWGYSSSRDSVDSSDIAGDVSDSEHSAAAVAGSSGSSSNSVQRSSCKAAMKGGVLVRDSSSSSSSSSCMKNAASSGSKSVNKGGSSSSNTAARSKQQKRNPFTMTAATAAATTSIVVSTPKRKAAPLTGAKCIAKKHSAGGTNSSSSGRKSCADSLSVVDSTVSPYFSRAASNTHTSSDLCHAVISSGSTSGSSGISSVSTPSRSSAAGSQEVQQVAATSPFFAAAGSPNTAYTSSSSVSSVLVRPAHSSGSNFTSTSSSGHTDTNSSGNSISSGLSALQLRRRSQSADTRSRLAVVGCSSVDEQSLQTP
jgi:hypothetical protein